MAYPSSIDSFGNPQGTSLLTSPDHALDHRNLGSAAVAIETVLGTTNGTSVLKNFAAGDFPARINTSNVLQQRVSGTVDNAILGTPAITGGTANNQVLGTPRLTLGSDAQGDMFYRSSAGTTTRLAPGTAGQVLKTQGAGANPIWGRATQIVSGTIGTATLTQAGTTYGTIAGLGGTITKSANTDLVVLLKIGQIRNQLSSAGLLVNFSVNGTIQGDESSLYFRSSTADDDRKSMSGHHIATGLPAGAYPVHAVWKAVAGTAEIGSGLAGSRIDILET